MIDVKWDRRFLELADVISGWSKDDSTKVGAILVDANKIVRCVGYNGIPRELDDTVPERLVRPEKYQWFNHAELNLLSNCARIGIPTDGCTIYVTHHPCAACIRNIIQSGIPRVVCNTPSADFQSRWADELALGAKMASGAGVQITQYERQ
jgi:dCMP deaminase